MTRQLGRVLPWLVVPLLIGFWEIVGRVGVFNEALLPAPSIVWHALLEMLDSGVMVGDIASSAKRAVVGYAVGCGVGVMMGALTGRSLLAERMLGPLFHLLRSFPPVALVPFAILWFGIAETSKYFLVFWGVFFPVWVNTHAGMSQVQQAYLWAARSLGAGRWHLITEALLPAALPHILAGMRVAIGIAFICVFVAEMSGVYEGVGFRISTSYLVFRVDKMIASLLVLGAMGAAADGVFRFATGRLFPWIKLGANHG